MNSAAIVLHPRDVTDHVEVDSSLLKFPVIFCAGDFFYELRKMIPAPLQVWQLVGVDHFCIKVEIAENQIRSVTCPPIFSAAIVASDADSLSLAADAASWLRSHGSRFIPEPAIVTCQQSAQLAADVAGKMAEHFVDQAEFITMLSREISSFRTSNERLQNNFQAAEAVLARKGLQAYDLDFVNEPVDTRSNVLTEATHNRIAQILPVGSTGVSAVGIHLTELPPRGRGVLEAQIISLEDGIVLDSWNIAISALHSGWNVFGFEKSLAGLPRTLELTISGAGGAELPRLSLGAPQVIERFRVHDADSRQSLADASLALQVWTGLAAVALPNWATYWSSRSRPGKGTDLPLRQEAIAPDILGFATHYNTDEVDFAFEAVQALVPERAVACHPPAFGITIARLPGACPAGALRVSACALVDNEKSQEVEFALVTATDGDRARSLFRGDISPTAGESFSNWIRVSPMAKQAVNAFISQPVASSQDVFIATRMVEAGNNDFAWAKFQDLTAVFQDLV